MSHSYRLRDVRKKHGLTQAQVAEFLGITPNAYNQYENGKRDIPTDSLIALSELYKCSTDELLGSWVYYSFIRLEDENG